MESVRSVRSVVRAIPDDAVVAMGIALFAGVFRLYQINGRSLWLDEIGEAVTAHLSFSALFEAVRVDAAATPLDYLGERLTTAVFGNGTTATRLWAVAVGCLACVVVYFVARQLFESRRAGVLAAVCLATSPFAIYYSQEARFYSLAMLVTALNVLAFTRAWRRGGFWNWLAYAGASALVLYTHYFAGAVLLPTVGVFVVVAGTYDWVRDSRKPELLRLAVIQAVSCVLSMLVAVALFAPWLVYATLPELGRTYGGAPLPALDANQLGAILAELLGGLYRPDGATYSLTGVLLVAAAVGAAAALKSRRGIALVLVVTIAAAIPVAWLADSREHYFWASRQVAFVVPLVCILAGGGLWTLVRVLGRAAGSALNSTVVLNTGVAAWAVAVSMLSWGPISRSYEIPKDDWRGVTQLIRTTACPDAHFLVNIPDHYDFGIGYYDAELLPRTAFLSSPTADLSDLAPSAYGFHDWFVVLTYAPGTGSLDRLSSVFASAGWTEHDFNNIRAYQNGASCGLPPSK